MVEALGVKRWRLNQPIPKGWWIGGILTTKKHNVLGKSYASTIGGSPLLGSLDASDMACEWYFLRGMEAETWQTQPVVIVTPPPRMAGYIDQKGKHPFLKVRFHPQNQSRNIARADRQILQKLEKVLQFSGPSRTKPPMGEQCHPWGRHPSNTWWHTAPPWWTAKPRHFMTSQNRQLHNVTGRWGLGVELATPDICLEGKTIIIVIYRSTICWTHLGWKFECSQGMNIFWWLQPAKWCNVFYQLGMVQNSWRPWNAHTKSHVQNL